MRCALTNPIILPAGKLRQKCEASRLISGPQPVSGPVVGGVASDPALLLTFHIPPHADLGLRYISHPAPCGPGTALWFAEADLGALAIESIPLNGW